jgi:hypothetical protein
MLIFVRKIWKQIIQMIIIIVYHHHHHIIIILVVVLVHVQDHANQNEHVHHRSKLFILFILFIQIFSSNNRRDSAASRLKEAERRERRRKGLPPLKEDHLVGKLNHFKIKHLSLFMVFVVSSRTLWLGHLPKMISEMELREHLEPHGEINDINVNLILYKSLILILLNRIFLHVAVHLFALKNVQMRQDV